jgi:hypothetical protein
VANTVDYQGGCAGRKWQMLKAGEAGGIEFLVNECWGVSLSLLVTTADL